MTRARRISLLLVITLLAIVVHGYHSGTDDGVIYAPGIKKAADPSLYPFDSEFFIHHAQLSLFPQLVAAVTWLTEKGGCESLGERANAQVTKSVLLTNHGFFPAGVGLFRLFGRRNLNLNGVKVVGLCGVHGDYSKTAGRVARLNGSRGLCSGRAWAHRVGS